MSEHNSGLDTREQHNEGQGTFVGRDVHGGVRNFFLFFLNPARHKQNDSHLPVVDRSAKQEISDDESPASHLIFAVLLASTGGALTWFGLSGQPLNGDVPVSLSAAQRILSGVFGIVLFLACTACAFARMAEIFALWAGSATNSTKSNVIQYPRIAAANSKTASGAARLARAAATTASFIAVPFGWFSLGTAVSKRAHQASTKATSDAKNARTELRKQYRP